jgi:hypothetical protein
VRRAVGRYERHPVERERLANFFGAPQMAEMDGVERATEDADTSRHV